MKERVNTGSRVCLLDVKISNKGKCLWGTSHERSDVHFRLIISDHIDHIKNVAGIDHVGFGSDYDGVPRFDQSLFIFVICF